MNQHDLIDLYAYTPKQTLIYAVKYERGEDTNNYAEIVELLDYFNKSYEYITNGNETYFVINDGGIYSELWPGDYLVFENDVCYSLFDTIFTETYSQVR